ncbi:MAG: immunoglobulin domain-containing protein [Verrucomicrobiota bacterium]
MRTLTNVVAIAGGGEHSLALRADGTVAAWGDNRYGQTNIPAGLTNVVAIAGGAYHSLALVAYGPPAVTPKLADRIVVAGLGRMYFQPAVVGARPMAYQWQFNGLPLPGATNGLLVLTNVSPAQAGLYALSVSNAFGSVTAATSRLAVVPVWIRTQPQSLMAQLGGTATLTVEVQGIEPLSYQWRFNGVNLAGATNAALVLTNLQARQGGSYSVLVSNPYGSAISQDAWLEFGTTLAWGDNAYGQTNIPAGLTNVVAIAGGGGHSLALRADGTVAAWGYNGDGRTNVPAGLTSVVAVAGGYYHSLALRANGTVVAWGFNGNGETAIPAGLTNVVAVAGGYYHSLALRANGTVVAWGYNGSGQTNVPAGLTNVVAIAGGYYHSLALRANGTVAAWGDNGQGQTNIPAGLTNVVAVAGGGFHSLALVGVGVPPRVPPSIVLQPHPIQNGHFGFNLVNQPGQHLEVQVSTNLAQWSTIQVFTNSGTFYFEDSATGNYERRFYRLRLP